MPSISPRRRRNKRAARGLARMGCESGSIARGSKAASNLTRDGFRLGLMPRQGGSGMKRRTASFLLTLAAASGCMTSQGGFVGHAGMQQNNGALHLASSEQGGPVGPWGVPMVASGGMGGMMSSPMTNPASIMQAGYMSDGQGILQMSGGCSGGACSLPGAPPMMGGMGPMGPMGGDPGCYATGGRVNSFGHLPNGPDASMMAQRTQVRFVGPAGAKVGWYIAGADGKPSLSPAQLDMPGRYNFAQAAIYRLKVSSITGRPGVEIYPSIEVVPSNVKTDAFLSHNVVPVEFTDEDFDQINAGHYITKVIYLPDAQYQSLAGGAEELSSTRLEPGVDPIAEAMRRGHILLVVRVGSINLDVPNSPPINAPGQYGAPQGGPAPMAPGGGAPPVPPGPGGVTPAGFNTPAPGMGQPGMKAPRAAFPQTMINAPKGLGFDADDMDQPSFKVRNGILDRTVWGR